MSWKSNSFLRLIRALWRMGYGDVLIGWINWRRFFYILVAFAGGFTVGANVPYEWLAPLIEPVVIEQPNTEQPNTEFNDIPEKKPDIEPAIEQPNDQTPNTEQERLPWEN